YLLGQTLNTMTLGGFALAVGILVDNSTVVIENIERHVGLDKPLYRAIVDGAGEVGLPTFLATLTTGNRNPSGMIPITVEGSPLTRTLRPTTVGSAAYLVVQMRLPRITTAG